MGEARRVYSHRNGVRRTLIANDETPRLVTVKTEQDIEPVLDSIARDRDIMPHGENKLVARLPVVVWEKISNLDEAEFKVWLNSSEAAPWRVWQGRV